MRYLCVWCNYIYNEDLGDKTEGIKPGTKFEELPENFTCPVCWETKDMFQEIKEEINYLWEQPKDVLEIEHFINVKKIDSNNIQISIWYNELHPSWEEHRITSIWIYDEYWDLIYEEFFQAWEDAILEYDISDFDEYEIRARCSIHWVWGRKFG